MNSLDIVGQYGLSNALPILCGVALIKIEKKEKNDINRKQDFITLLDEVVERSKFKLLPELKNWVTLTCASLDDNIFFSIYNVANRHSALDIMDYFNKVINWRIFGTRLHSIKSNESLSKLAISIINLNKDETFLDPVATKEGAWLQILKKNPNQRITLQTFQPLEACLAYLNAKANHGKNVKIYNQNILIGPKYINENKELIHFDSSIAAPPLNLRIPSNLINNSYNLFKYGEIGSTSTVWGFVSSILGSLNKNGRATVFLANGSLFGAGNRKIVRNNVLRDDKIEAIISFPERFFADALIPINLIVFNNHKTDMKNKILFIDANQPGWIQKSKVNNSLTSKGIEKIVDLTKSPRDIPNISKVKSIDECQDTLMVNKYVIKNHVSLNGEEYDLNLTALAQRKTIPIKEIVNIQRGFNMMRNKEDKDSQLKVVKISDFTEDGKINYAALTGVKDSRTKDLNEYQIHENDIIFSVRGSLGKAFFIETEPENPTIISSNMVIIRPKNRDIEPKWLYLYLNSLFTKYFLKKTESGTTVSILTFRDLENLPIAVCSREKQEEMIDFYDKKNEQVVALQSKLQEEKDELESQLGEMLGSDKVFLRKK
ncbi:type I restriction-modification system subunit M/S [Lactobacillus crispatus]|uniref:type I restriction-modification system subunit M/S n=1 Tax=Lactobacillus crispatus TaxID=47770 RepID=UPI0030FB8B91